MNINMFKDAAKESLHNCVASGNDFAPVAFFVDGDQPIICSIIAENSDMHVKYRSLGALLGERGITEVILVNDCAMRQISCEDLKYVMKNYDTENALSYPESMRIECLVFLHINFKEKDNKMSMITYKKVGKKVEFLEEISEINSFDGEIQRVITEGFFSTKK